MLGRDLPGLLALLTLALLGASCVYVGDPNHAPELQLSATSGPFHSGQEITVDVEVQDRDAQDQGRCAVTYQLTDAEGQPLPAGATTPCAYGASGCFVPHQYGLVYRMTVTAVDPHGAEISASQEFTLEDRVPQAALEARGVTRPNGHYSFLVPIQFTPIGSSDPDAEDLCRLAYDLQLVDQPMASNANLESCPVDDLRAGCDEPVHTMCLTPDAAGTYRVRLVVTDAAGATDEIELSVEVDGDQPPCLRHITPAPLARIFVSRGDLPLQLSVTAEDDLDPYPPLDSNATDYPIFAWSIQTPLDAELVVVPGYESNQYGLDQPLSAGDEVLVRVEVRDRSSDLCAAQYATCPKDADPLAGDCVQRVTWTLEVY